MGNKGNDNNKSIRNMRITYDCHRIIQVSTCADFQVQKKKVSKQSKKETSFFLLHGDFLLYNV